MNWAPISFIAGWVLWFYTFGILLAELILGGQAFHLILKFYDFDLDGIAINAFCRDIYKDTKNMCINFLVIGILGLVALLVCFVYFVCYKLQDTCWKCQPFFPDCDDSNSLNTGPIICNLLGVFMAVGVCGFLTWKVNSLSIECADFWNNWVSPDFIQLFQSTKTLLIISGIGAGGWMLGLVAVFIYANVSQ